MINFIFEYECLTYYCVGTCTIRILLPISNDKEKQENPENTNVWENYSKFSFLYDSVGSIEISRRFPPFWVENVITAVKVVHVSWNYGQIGIKQVRVPILK